MGRWRLLFSVPAAVLVRPFGWFFRRLEIAGGHALKVVRAINRIATIRLFDAIASMPNAEQYLVDIVERLRGKPKRAWALSCAIGLAIKRGSTEIGESLTHQIVRDYPDEIGMLKNAGTQTFLAGDYKTAEFVWEACHRRREQLIREQGLDRLGLRFLGPSWVIAIGHIAHLDTYFKWCQLTGRDHRALVSIPVGFKVPNSDLLDRWRPFLESKMPAGVVLTLPQVEILQDEFWGLEIPNDRWRMFSYAGAWVQAEWEKLQRKPLLALSEEDWARGRESVARLGIPERAWYVCLHVREPGFHEVWHKQHPATRNADILTYIDAVRAVTERGGYVLRMGDVSMRQFPSMPNVIDYAHSDAKSEFMDVFLCASCKFFVGTNSGLGLVPPIFGVPCVLTNWSPIGLPQWYPNDLFVPKLCYSELLGRMLTFEEMFQSQAGWGQFADYFERERISVLDNSPEDLRDLVVEMLEREEGTLREAPADAALYEAYLELALAADSYAGARIGRRFLHKYRSLLPDRARAPVPADSASPRYAES